MTTASLIVRAAKKEDVEAIYQLISLYVPGGVVLQRSREDITFYLGNFVVAEMEGEVCGCCAARDFGNDLLEVRSLIVAPDHHRQGIGKAMLDAIIAKLNRERQSWRLFTLTLRSDFFLALGFRPVSKEMFPEKIWSDCSKCPKILRCDESALLLEREYR